VIFGLWSGSRSQVGSGKQGETMAAHLKKPEKELIAEKEAPSGFLATIERVGNMVPHPAIIFFILIGIVIVLSVIFGLLGTTVTYDGYDPAISDIVEQTASVRSLLSPDGIRFMLTSPVSNFLGFTGVGVILVAMIGVGLAEESGLIATLVRKLVAIAPRSIFTFMIVMVGVLSSIAADAGYLVLVPLAAAAFHSLGRHPLAGLAAGFSGVAAVFLVNVFITPTDALLVEVTNDAIRAVNPAAQISVVGNLFFMIVSSILMGIICTVLTERFVEPRLGPYTGGVPVEAATGLSGSEQLGLKYAGRALLGFVVVIGLLTAPPLPWGILRNQETGGIMAGSPFMSGLIILISLLFLVVGFAYGKGAGTIANVTAAIGLIVKTWSNLAGMIFLLFVIANFIAFFNYTNLATVLAVNLAEFLQTVPIGMTGYIVIFVIVVAVIDIILAGALAKWAILAPVFVPLFMQLGGDPNLALAAYRVGDSPMNVITPLNVYLAVMVGFAQKYQKDTGIGTIVALMLPYTVTLLVLWTLMLVVWYALGIPLGPA
jgi:aminobenzoyl-glutamate transport protein